MKEIRDILSSWKTTAVLFAIYAVALAAATFIEAKIGSPAARSVIYTAWWMYVLYGLFIVNFIFVSRRMLLARRRAIGVIILHWGFIVTIIGALVTHIWSYEGIMHIRQGGISDTIVFQDGTSKQVPFNVELNDFTVVRYHGSNSPSSFESDVTITHDGKSREQKIFMNNIARVAGYRIYQSSYDRDEMGTILTVNFDPAGTAVTYVGYFLLIAGMAVALCQKGSRLRTLYSSIGKTTV